MNEEWTTVIKPKTGWFDINFKEIPRLDFYVCQEKFHKLLQADDFRAAVVYYKSAADLINAYGGIRKNCRNVN